MRLLNRVPSKNFITHVAHHTIQPASPSTTTLACPLPAETLREIFLYCIADSIGDLDPYTAPLLLRRVSTDFRAIADSTPALWRTISITQHQILLSNVQVVKEWMVRSGTTSPLDVCVYASPDSNQDILVALLAELVPSHCRWRNLVLSIPVELLPMLLSNPDARLPMLQSLMLVMEDERNFTFDSPDECPLRYHSLSTHSSLVEPHGSAWGLITHLNIKTVTGTVDALWNLFAHCPRLFFLSVTARLDLPIPKPPSQLFHSNIHYLIMSVDAHPALIGSFLDRMYLPCLHELQPSFEGDEDPVIPWPRFAILDLRERCLPPLYRVVISGKFILEEDLVYFVQRMKHLEQLEVWFMEKDLVTPRVRDLLPQNETAVLRRQSAYWDEVHDQMFI
jgi:hypothetical protein